MVEDHCDVAEDGVLPAMRPARRGDADGGGRGAGMVQVTGIAVQVGHLRDAGTEYAGERRVRVAGELVE